jgi:hypothetical protein
VQELDQILLFLVGQAQRLERGLVLDDVLKPGEPAVLVEAPF